MAPCPAVELINARLLITALLSLASLVDLRYLSRLEHLILDDNHLSEIPPVLCAATRLTRLELSRNPLFLTNMGLAVSIISHRLC